MILEYERAPIEEIHPDHWDHRVQIFVVKVVTERDFVDLGARC